jgi:hypothetical protein
MPQFPGGADIAETDWAAKVVLAGGEGARPTSSASSRYLRPPDTLKGGALKPAERLSSVFPGANQTMHSALRASFCAVHL